MVKQSATPSLTNPANPLQWDVPNALRDQFVRHIKEDAALSNFDIWLQFLDTDRMTYTGKRRDASFWIENALEWNERQTPFHPVARLTILAISQLSAEESDSTYFGVTQHRVPESEPVGSINRARWRAEAASRQAPSHVGTATGRR
jgi:hypothetical protein